MGALLGKVRRGDSAADPYHFVSLVVILPVRQAGALDALARDRRCLIIREIRHRAWDGVVCWSAWVRIRRFPTVPRIQQETRITDLPFQENAVFPQKSNLTPTTARLPL